MTVTPVFIQEFETILLEACDTHHCYDTETTRPYQQVRVLCFHSQTDKYDNPNIEQTGVGNYCDRVEWVFSQGYGYTTKTYMINRSGFGQGLLSSALYDAFAGMESDCLVILYYVGHGKYKPSPNGVGQLFLQEHDQENRQTPQEINFTALRTQIIDC